MATKTREEYIDGNIKTFLQHADKTKIFGTGYVLRLCKIEYSAAEYTIAEMLNRQLITVDDIDGWNITFKFINT